MTAQEVAKEMMSLLRPKLEELGVEGFVMSGYCDPGSGRLERFVVCCTNKNAAIEDGLGPMAHVASAWATPPGHAPQPGPTPGTLGFRNANPPEDQR